jgi:hypothetical protein
VIWSCGDLVIEPARFKETESPIQIIDAPDRLPALAALSRGPAT